VAFVSLASSFSNRARSSDPIGEVPGTPGINGLRTRRFSVVTPQVMQGLRAMAKAYDDAGVSTAGTFNNTLLSGADWDYRSKPNELLLFGTYFREGDKPGLDYDMNETEVREILANIREGKARSDFLVVTMHAHESPAPFVQTIARAAIDNGADAFVGHGVFHPLGIEVYKGKPIYYGLSNFINQRALTGPIPLDEYERYGVPTTATQTEFRVAWNARAFRDKEVYRALVAVSRYDQGQLAELRLYPVDTYSDRPAALGIPHLPTPALAREILERIQQLSAPYGTNIRIENNVGVITVNSTH
jgi:poly-gamma-glutamate synthesis protein (capsule biosynthesis protein)